MLYSCESFKGLPGLGSHPIPSHNRPRIAQHEDASLARVDFGPFASGFWPEESSHSRVSLSTTLNLSITKKRQMEP